MIDQRALCRQFSSREFVIPTRSIFSLKARVDEWLQTNSCGGIVCGPSRCGKTCAIQYITKELKKIYGSELPIYTYTATTHIATQKTFYESLLLMLDHENASKGTANQMRQRIINRIVIDAANTKYRMAILWIDEAYLLAEREFSWMVDLYNGLHLNDIQLTVILVGTRELLETKKGLIKSEKQQFILRFFVNEAQFHGIESQSDLFMCMSSLEKEAFSVEGADEPIYLGKTFFPDAYRDGKDLTSFAADFWTAMQNLRKKHHIKADYLTMKCFMDTISHCIRKYGALAGEHNKVYAPSVAEWEDCLVDAAYVSSQVV